MDAGDEWGRLVTIYFAQASAGSPIKIGFTAMNNPRKRLKSLQTAQAERLVILGQCEGDYDTEAQIHRQLAAHRLEGEWFKPHADVLSFIAQACRKRSAAVDPPPMGSGIQTRRAFDDQMLRMAYAMIAIAEVKGEPISAGIARQHLGEFMRVMNIKPQSAKQDLDT